MLPRRPKLLVKLRPSQLAWLYRVKQIAGGMIVHPYSPRAVQRAMPDLSALLSAPEEARKVPRILAECGIRFAIVESLSSAKIDGVCFWLDETSPVIGMSLRYDRIDNFWFVLRHELEHVLRLHGRTSIYLDVELEGERAGTGADIIEEERQANEAAAAFCVPQERLNSFIARKITLLFRAGHYWFFPPDGNTPRGSQPVNCNVGQGDTTFFAGI